VGVESEWVERLLAEAADDPAHRPALEAALMEATVWVFGTVDPPPVAGHALPGDAIALVDFEDDVGRVVPFFTSETGLRESLQELPDTDPQSINLAARDLFDLTRGERLLCNPHSAYATYFLPDEIAALLDGSS
jgi:hypothetical protein